MDGVAAAAAPPGLAHPALPADAALPMPVQSLRDAPPPRGRKPKNMKLRERMQRKLRTKRGRIRYRQRGASVEPVFGQMKDRQGARRFSMRGLDRCRGEWLLDAAVHNLRKLHRDSACRVEKARERAAKRMQRAA